MLSHLLNSSFAAAPLILPPNEAREALTLLLTRVRPLIYARWGWQQALRERPPVVSTYTARISVSELRVSRLSFC